MSYRPLQNLPHRRLREIAAELDEAWNLHGRELVGKESLEPVLAKLCALGQDNIRFGRLVLGLGPAPRSLPRRSRPGADGSRLPRFEDRPCIRER